jgi:hypothetical protein
MGSKTSKKKVKRQPVTVLYKQVDADGKGKVVEVVDKEGGTLRIRNCRNGFEYTIWERDFENHYIEVKK